jgi:hypothetical protein
MLSFFSFKPIVSEKDQPKIVDFNTINNNRNNPTDKKAKELSLKKNTPFNFWPFGPKQKVLFSDKNNENSKNYDEKTNNGKPLLLDANDKVIAMKKINSSNADHDNNIEDDEFIDIQVRHLSYAEVAALDLEKSKSENTKKCRPLENNLMVIDQEDELEKSITDLEMVDNYETYEKFSNDISTPDCDILSPEDQWETYVDSKISKKLVRKKRSHKDKKISHI